MTKRLIIICSLLVSLNVMTQVTRASISQHEISIGERVTLSYSLPLKFSESIAFNPFEKFIPVLKSDNAGKNEKASPETVEILLPFRDTIIASEGGPVWTGYYEITVWDSGAFVVPGPKIKLGKEQLQFPGVSFTGRLTPPIKGLENYDIKEFFAELPPQTVKEKLTSFLSHYWWVIVLILIGLIGGIWYRRTKRKSSKDHKILTIYDQTIHKLSHLERKEAWKNGKVKAHYSELSLVLKNYLSDVYKLHLLERTTSETLILIQRKVDTKELTDKIKNILETADLVKFAKHSPMENEVRTHLHECIQLVILIHEQTSVNHE